MVRVGPFELRTLIGRGGIAEVFSAVHVRQDVPVALKVVTATYARSEPFLATFRTEIQAVARLDHPGIVMVLDHGIIDAEAESSSHGKLVAGSPFLAMELASEGSLDRLKGPLPWSDLCRVLLSVLDALAHAHARGVIHRDIKPANVLVASSQDHRPGLKLTDFGIAHATGLDTDPGLQAKQATLGTPAYMAPEQFFGSWRDFGPWTDLYALGCLAYALASGGPPFRGATPREVARMHVREPPRPLRSPHNLPLAFEEWVLRLLAKDPGDRFARAADASYALYMIDQALRRATGVISSTAEKTGEHVTRLMADARQPGVDATEHTPPPVGMRGRAATDAEAKAPLRNQGDENRTQIDDTRPSLAITSFSDLSLPALKQRPDAPAAIVPPLPPTWRSRVLVMPPPALVGAGLRLYGLRTIPLVDRESERDALWTELTRVSQHKTARAVIVRGAAGHGKTRLVESIAERADEVGAAIILRATHSPIASAADGMPRLLARHLRAIGLEKPKVLHRAKLLLERRGATDEYEWNAITELMVPSAEGDHADRAVRFSNAEERHVVMRRTLTRIAAERPVLVWIDDAQWGSEALGFARALLEAQDEDPAPIFVVITVRDEALPDRPIEADLIAQLSRRPDVQTIEVGRLTKNDHRRLVEELLSLEPKLAARVASRTDGNPLFAVQLVGDWVERGVLVPSERGFVLQPGEGGRIPDDIHAVWVTRIKSVLERHGPDARRALELAAVLGNEVDAAEWKALVEEVGLKIPPTLLLDLIAARLAEPTQQGWIFGHGMVRESLERDLTDSGQVAVQHRAAASMLARRHGAGVRGVTERVARHLLAAGDFAAALPPLFAAASERWEASELSEALALLDLRARAVARAQLGPDDPSLCEGDVLRAQIEIVRGNLDMAVRVAAEVELMARKEASSDARWQAVLVRALMAQAHGVYERGEQSRAVNFYQQARSRAEQMGDVAAIVRSIQGLADAAYRLGDLDGAARLYGEGLARAQEAKLETAMAEAHWGIGYVALWKADYESARVHFLEQRRLLTAQGNQLGIARATNALGELARLEGDLETAERDYRRALSLHHAIGSSGTLVTRLNLALVLLIREDHAAAERLITPMLRELSRTGERGHLTAAHCQLLPCRAASRDWEGWDRDLALAEKLLEETALKDGDVALSLELAGELANRHGQPVRALRALEQANDQWRILGRSDKQAHTTALIEKIRGG